MSAGPGPGPGPDHSQNPSTSHLDHDRQPRSTSLSPPPASRAKSPNLAAAEAAYRHGHTAHGKHSLNIDPRTSSSQSLYSTISDSDQRRTLLIIYIHGFYGNNQSFRSFPYHVHSYLRSALSESHVIHSKIYPRYKTYRAIEVARDNFSEWLVPHESPTTDVILVGHSMGGILAADVVLMPNRNPYRRSPFKHRILGIIAMDCPFLGLHPGIIVAGISSLFQPAQQPPQEDGNQGSSSSQEIEPTQSSTRPPNRQPTDPFFNPPFWNDNPFKEAPFFKRITHFANKHRSEGILNATAKHVVSHLEYGGCLADFHGLNVRYNKIRALENVDELQALGNGHLTGDDARVRFVNYYTLSSGRPKPPKSPSGSQAPSQTSLVPATSKSTEGDSILSRELTRETTTTTASSIQRSSVSISVADYSDTPEPSMSPSISLKDSKRQSIDESKTSLETQSVRTGIDNMSLQNIDPRPIPDDQLPESPTDPDLPPIPDPPTRPPTPDLEQYSEKEVRKHAEREFKQFRKIYERKVKDRNRAIHNRNKILQKRRKKEEKEAAAEATTLTQDFQDEPASPISSPASTPEEAHTAEKEELKQEKEEEKPKKKKNKKFCTLPKKVNGATDPTWVDIYMDGMDEVGAHCGLFFPGPHYDRLVGDFSERIIDWVQEDMTKRTILEMHQSA